jgi:signal transduction histidine kinase
MPSMKASFERLDTGQRFGWSRVGLFIGLVALTVGLVLAVVSLAWVGVGIVALAFVVNAITKINYFRDLPLVPDERTRLAFVWALLAITMVGFVVDIVLSRFRAGYTAHFWSFAFAAFGLVVIYRYLRRADLPEDMVANE